MTSSNSSHTGKKTLNNKRELKEKRDEVGFSS